MKKCEHNYIFISKEWKNPYNLSPFGGKIAVMLCSKCLDKQKIDIL